MGKWLKSASLWLLAFVFVPALLTLFADGAKALGWDAVTGGYLKGAVESLVWFVGTDLYRYLVVAVVALTVGVLLDWIVRQFDARQKKTLAVLGTELDSIRYRLQKVHDQRERYGELNSRALTMISTEFLALKVTLYKLGIRTPDRNWIYPEDPTEYLLESLGWLAIAAPLMKRGHIEELKDMSQKLLPVKFPSSESARPSDGW